MRRFWGFVLASSVLCGLGCFGPKRGASCAEGRCAEGQVCDPVTQLCVEASWPLVTITSPAAGEVITGSVVKLAGAVTGDEPLDSLQLYVDDSAEGMPLELASGGGFETTLPALALDSQFASFRVVAVNSAGKEGWAAVTFTVDNVPPRCRAVFPENGQGLAVATDRQVLLTYEVLDGSGSAASAEVSIDGAPFTPAHVSGTLATLEWTVPAGDDSVAHALSFRATDAHGNACEKVETSVYADSTAPTLVVLTPDAGAVLGPASVPTTVVAGRAQDGDAPVTLVTVDFRDGIGPRRAEPAPSGEFALEIPLAEEDWVNHRIVIRAVDRAGNRTEKSVDVVVDRIPPEVTFLSPANGRIFLQSDFVTTESVSVQWKATDGSPVSPEVETKQDLGPWVSALSGALEVLTTATDNPAHYGVQVRARDAAGNETLTSIGFEVDRVPPTFVATPPANARIVSPVARIEFSEPVVQDSFAPPLVLSPDAGTGTWLPGQVTFEVGPLAPDELYLTHLAVAAKDLAGNPVVSEGWYYFLTASVPPPVGVALLSNVEQFSATADSDGKVSFVAKSPPPYSLTWGYFDPEDGLPRTIRITSAANVVQFAAAAGQIRSTGTLLATALRGYAAVESVPPPPVVPPVSAAYWQTTSGGITSALATQVVLTSRSCAEDPVSDEVGLLISSSGQTVYHRPPNPDLPLGFAAATLAVGEGSAWHAFGFSGSSLVGGWFECRCGAVPPTCSVFRPPGGNWATDLAPSPKLSVAVTSNRLLFVYDNAAGARTEACVSCPGLSSCGTPWTRTVPRPEGLAVAAMHQGDWVIGTRMVSGEIQLVARDLGSCTSDWVIVSRLFGVTPWGIWPTVFGTTPGFLYGQGSSVYAHTAP